MINPVVTTVSTDKSLQCYKEMNMLRKQVSDHLGIDTETLRFYEKINLISSPKRQENGYRNYNENHLQELKFVQHCRSLGIGINEIKVLKGLLNSGKEESKESKEDCHEAKEIIDENLVLIEERIKELKLLKKQLKTLSSSCVAPSSPKDCKIVKSLEKASLGESCLCHD